jgi:hypothetical protein
MDKGRVDYPIASRATQHWHAITTATWTATVFTEALDFKDQRSDMLNSDSPNSIDSIQIK